MDRFVFLVRSHCKPPFLLAWLIFRTQMVSVAMVEIALFVFVLALRRLDIAMLIVIAEMIAGSHGHPLSTKLSVSQFHCG